MQIRALTNRLLLIPEDTEIIQSDRYIGVSRSKGSKCITVEDCLTNRIKLQQGFWLLNTERVFTSLQYQPPMPLKPYQVQDVLKMLNTKYVLNRNPMGLGKTIETIQALRELGQTQVCIVAPKSTLSQWVHQIQLWWPEAADKVCLYGKTMKTLQPNKIYIVNYEKLINKSTLAKFRAFVWAVLVVDEAHRLKNRESQRTLAIKSIPAIRKWALTGTPILNRPDDLWSVLHFLHPKISGTSYWNFVNYYCNIVDGYWGREIKGLTRDQEHVSTLNALMQAVSIYNDVEVAVGTTVETVLLPMEPPQKALYKLLKQVSLGDASVDDLPENVSVPNGAVLVLRLRQLLSWPGVFLPEVMGTKFSWILNLCLDNPTEKILVYTSFEKTAIALRTFLRENSVRAVTYTGSQTDVCREQNKAEFLSNPDTQVFIGTIGAVGVGTDGLQQVSHTCVFVDGDWSPEINQQAIDRLHRMGQQHLVNVYMLEHEKSFDQYVSKVNSRKESDIKEALKNETN